MDRYFVVAVVDVVMAMVESAAASLGRVNELPARYLQRVS